MSQAYLLLFYSDFKMLFTSAVCCISCEPRTCMPVAFGSYMLLLQNQLITLIFLFPFDGDDEKKALPLRSPYTEGHKQQSALLLLLKQGSFKGISNLQENLKEMTCKEKKSIVTLQGQVFNAPSK